MASYDVVIRKRAVADGSGRQLFAADVALKGDRIAAVEPPGMLRGDNEIDAGREGLAPGSSTSYHDDTALIDNPTMAMKAARVSRPGPAVIVGASAAPFVRRDIGHFLSLIVKKKENVSK